MTKTFLIAAAALAMLASCDETMTTLPAAAPTAAAGSNIEITDSSIAGRLDSASKSGSIFELAYYTDTVSDLVVLDAADRMCAPGHALPTTAGRIFSEEQRGGRTYHIMSFSCT